MKAYTLLARGAPISGFWYQESPIFLPLKDRFSHLWIIGATGTGKTSLLNRLILSDLQAGFGLGVIDTHELADSLLDEIRRSRIKDVCLFDLSDPGYTIGLNPFALSPSDSDSENKHLIVETLISQWRRIWSYSWGPNLENTLRHSCLTLIDLPGACLADLRLLLISKRYREKILSRCQDPHLLSFWRNEFEARKEEYQVEAVNPILNKLDAFLASPLRAPLCTRIPRLNLRRLIDRGGILLVPLNKGLLGEETANFAGSIILSQLLQAVLSRLDTPEEERDPWFLYIDEFLGNNLAVNVLKIILNEARKMKVGLILSQHFLAESDPLLVKTLLANVGSLICFRTSARDAPLLESHLSTPSEPLPRPLTQLENYQCYIRILWEGNPRGPFLSKTLPPPPRASPSWREKIIAVSRAKYARPKELIESSYDKLLERWLKH
jgi:hypothetical protein